MTAADLLRTQDLARRLSEAEATIEALLSGQIDAVVDAGSSTPILLANAQAALRESEERLRHERDRAQRYLDTATVMLIALDLDGRIMLANRFACAVLGWEEPELLGRDWFETCLAPRLREQVKARFGDLLRGAVPIAENVVLTRSGEERIVEWRSTVNRDDRGQVIGSLSSGTDITERSRAIAALRTAEERMRFALEAANVGIWELDWATGAFQWSEILETQNGLQPGRFGGTREAFMACIHPDDRPAMVATFEAAARSGADFSEEHRSIWPDGTVRWLSGAGRIHLGPYGEPVRGIGVSIDVTERHTLDEQYRQAQKMEAVGRLASGVAHDFNNLLTVILGFTEFVSADAARGSQHASDLAEIIKAAQSASGLTRQLLAFSRQQVLHAAPLDVNGLMADMTVMLGRLIGEHIEVTLTLSPRLCLALADRGQLEQVVMNLVVNARDAMPDGGRLTIETKDVTLEPSSSHPEAIVPGPYVLLAIGDTGTGMDKETQRRIFEPFFTTKETGKGTGLGLSTTYGIVKQSKGYIWVDSELGRGTIFNIYLPCPAANETVAVVEPVAVAAPARRASETVLLVEDEPGVRQLATRILDKAGYRVLEAANGEDAERIFAQYAQQIDLVVTDVVMPGCGGPELLSRLQVSAPELRVLYMSGYTEQSAAHTAGIDRGLPFVQKPFTAVEFAQQVRDALDR
jgi:two-component system cell cycle sensor histidine kinase/response regulator CckA